jgi:hypothetical protein
MPVSIHAYQASVLLSSSKKTVNASSHSWDLAIAGAS